MSNIRNSFVSSASSKLRADQMIAKYMGSSSVFSDQRRYASQSRAVTFSDQLDPSYEEGNQNIDNILAGETSIEQY